MTGIDQSADILHRAAAVARTDRNLEMLDCAALLHVYLELFRLRPDDSSARRDLEEAIRRLLDAANRHPMWRDALLEFTTAEAVACVA